VDVHKAIRRAHPAPHARAQRKDLLVKDAAIRNGTLVDLAEEEETDTDGRTGRKMGRNVRTPSLSGRSETPGLSRSPTTTLLLRRSSADPDGRMVHTTVPLKTNFEDMKGHLKNLGPSNPASNPKSTRVSAVKIKPGTVSTPSVRPSSGGRDISDDLPIIIDEQTSLLRPRLTANDGTQALHNSLYGSPSSIKFDATKPSAVPGNGNQVLDRGSRSPRAKRSQSSADGSSSVSSLEGDVVSRKRGYVRSGSITENIVEAGGIRKVVLEANTSSESENEDVSRSGGTSVASDGDKSPTGSKKNNRRKNRKGRS